MKTIVVAARKGGVGKTTLAAHLSLQAAEQYGEVVLVDTDEQGSLSLWWNRRPQGAQPAFAVVPIHQLEQKMPAFRARFKAMVIDTPPNVSTLIERVIRLADVVVLPTRAGALDLQALSGTLALLRGKPHVFVVNSATRSRLTASTMSELHRAAQETGGAVAEPIFERVAVTRAMGMGIGVEDARAQGEIAALWSLVVKQMDGRDA